MVFVALGHLLSLTEKTNGANVSLPHQDYFQRLQIARPVLNMVGPVMMLKFR